MKGWLEPMEADESVLPVSLDIVKAHLRIETSDDDALIETYIRAAAREFERQTSRGLYPAHYAWRLDSWPKDGEELPFGPVRSVDRLTWIDSAGNEQEVDGAEWSYALSDRGARLCYETGFSAPRPGRPLNGIAVWFSAGHDPAGYQATESEARLQLPQTAVSALLLLVGHWYQNREAVNVGNLVTQLPLGAVMLMSGLRIYR